MHFPHSTRKDEFCSMNLPNALTIVRLILVPVFAAAYFLVPESYFYLPAVVLLLSGLTDMLDGYFARRFHQITPLGQFLDPVADKLTMFTVIVCLAVSHKAVLMLLLIFVVKELAPALIGLVLLKSWRNSIPAKWYGKVTTILLYALLCGVLIFPQMPENLLFYLALIPAAFIILSFIFYLKEIIKRKDAL